jgi:hypothetical protein
MVRRIPAKEQRDDDPWGEKAYTAILARRPKHTVRDHLEALKVSTEVTNWCRKEREPNALNVTAENVIAALNDAGIRPVLMGTFGINGYRDEARATQDVDVLVTKKDARKAVRVLEEAFPYLEVQENAAVARFVNPVSMKVVLDVMKPASRAIQAVFRHTVAIGKTHRIPDLEMALVSKFLAMTATNRRPDKKLVDAGDFMNIVQHNRTRLDVKKLTRLAGHAQPGGSARIEAMLVDIDAGRTITF